MSRVTKGRQKRVEMSLTLTLSQLLVVAVIAVVSGTDKVEETHHGAAQLTEDIARLTKTVEHDQLTKVAAGEEVDGEVKRAWGSNNMRVWGKRDDDKRAWGSNNMRVWGKRGDGDMLIPGDDKRAWGTNNMRVWGKRSVA